MTCCKVVCKWSICRNLHVTTSNNSASWYIKCDRTQSAITYWSIVKPRSLYFTTCCCAWLVRYTLSRSKCECTTWCTVKSINIKIVNPNYNWSRTNILKTNKLLLITPLIENSLKMDVEAAMNRPKPYKPSFSWS